MFWLIDPLRLTPGYVPFNVSSFHRILGDNLSTGECHTIDLETVEGFREELGKLGPNAVVFFNLREEDVPQGERSQ